MKDEDASYILLATVTPMKDEDASSMIYYLDQ
jgi:hypothetical protein